MFLIHISFIYVHIGEERKRCSVIKLSKRQASPMGVRPPPVIAVDDKLSEEDEKDKELVKK